MQPSPVTAGKCLELVVDTESHGPCVEGPTPVVPHMEGLPEKRIPSEGATPRALEFDPMAVPRKDANSVRLFARIFRNVLIGQIRPPRPDGLRRSVDVQLQVEVERSADPACDRPG